jgi:hypothetical protein
MSIIQQLEDLKEWSQDSTRYERRLAFRRHIPSTEAGTIPIEWDDLSDREREYYRTGPWSTREDYSKGQLVQPGPGRQGYQGVKSGSRPTSKPGGWKSRYKIKAFDKVADLFLNTYAKDDIDILYKVSKEIGNQISLIAKEPELLKHVSKQSGLSEKDIFDIIDDRKAHADLRWDVKTQEGIDVWNKPKKDLDNRMRNWLMKNSKKYADPEKFKKSFNRVFGKNNYINKAIKKDSLKRGTMLGFVDDNFVKTYISSGIKNPEDYTFKSRQLDDMFKTLIYNNNENVRNKVVKTFTDILPKERVTKSGVLDVYKAIKNNDFLKKFKLNEGINGPVARLIARSLDKDLVRQIDNFKKPYMGTRDLLNYLGDHVDSEYKSMFKEAEQAVVAMQSDKWSVARKNLDTGREIMFDHKIPSSLIEAGYADDIEYIKMNPTSQEFNVNIKAKKFDRPMNTLVRKFEKAKTLDAKTKIYEEMVAKKDAFSKKYGNYLDEVKITMDEKGKLKFASDAPVVTKKTDLTKMLKTSLGQQKFPTLSGKNKIKFLQSAGFPIKKCLNLAKGGSPDQCITGVVNETIEKAKRGDADAIKIFKNQKQVLKQAAKRGTGLATKLSWFLGPIDAPIELAFALPHLLMGDYEAAKRATTFGLTGWGEIDLDNVDDPEARKYMKHIRDTENWINNWQKHDYYTKKLENLPDDASRALRNTVEAEVNKRASNMDSIAQNYDGYDRSGSENEAWAYNPEEIAGKKAARNWINTKVETDLEKGLDATYRKQETPVGEIDISAYKDAAREKLRASPTDLESFIKTKGQDFYGDPEGWVAYNPLKQEEAEAHGVGDIYDDYYMGAGEGKDIRDSYSSIPLKYASQLGALEAKETREGLEAIRERQYSSPLNEMYYAGGGIAGLSGGKRFGPPPESGPMPQGGGLSSQFNRVKKLTG